MRIALLVEGTRGDVQPLVVLGEELQTQGHQVQLVGPPDSAELATGRVPYAPVGRDIRQVLTLEASEFAGASPLRQARASIRHLRESVDQQFEAYAPAVEEADLVVAGGLVMAGFSLAERNGIPYRYLAYTPSLLPAKDHAPVGIQNQRLPQWLNGLTWRLFLPGIRRLMAPAINRWRDQLGLPVGGHPWHEILTDRPLVAADPVLAAPPEKPLYPHRAVSIGTLLNREGAPLDPKLNAFLEAGDAPVYFGFGSMPAADPTETTALLADPIRQLGCRAVLSQGWADLGQQVDDERIFVTGPTCHRQLFPRCRAVVHHGGAGTTAAAAFAGAPQVFVAHIADQYYWAHRAWSLGLSPGVLDRRALTATALAELLRPTLESDWLNERARAFATELQARHVALSRDRSQILLNGLAG